MVLVVALTLIGDAHSESLSNEVIESTVIQWLGTLFMGQ